MIISKFLQSEIALDRIKNNKDQTRCHKMNQEIDVITVFQTQPTLKTKILYQTGYMTP